MSRKKQTLKNEVVLITGASSGLGKEIAFEAAKQGAYLILCGRNIAQLEQVKKECETDYDVSVAYYEMDLMHYESVDDALYKIKKEHPVVDVLVNCAGFGSFDAFADASLSEARRMFEVNVLGLMHVTQVLLLPMMDAQKGHVINIASQGGKMATPKSSIYSATKFAVIGFSNSLRLEMKPFNIGVTTVNPGPIKTSFFDKADPTGTYLSSVERIALEPNALAKKIVGIMTTKKREVNAPFIMEMGSKAYTMFPVIGDYLAGTLFNKK